MSSQKFAAELVPTRALRRLLLAVSASATLAGTALALSLDLRPAVKYAFVALWLCAGALEFASLWRGARRIERLCMSPDGGLYGLGPTGDRERLRLLAGSVVLARVAWLRLHFTDGLRYGELLIDHEGTAGRDWHCLQLIWRQRASIFGRTRVS